MTDRETGRVRRLVVAGLRGVQYAFDQAFDRRVERRIGLVPIQKTLPGDVYICGYPKSGNTWFQHMSASVVYGADIRLAPDTLINDLIPDVHFKAYYRRYAEPCFFKSHHLPRPEYRRVVYLLRDGRDAMVSYFHHLQAMSGRVDFHELVRTGKGLFPSKWHEHVERYMSNPYGAEMIVIRYEDLKRDALGELRRFCEFAGLRRENSTLEQAVDRAAFDSMKQKEQQSGWETPGWPKDKPFVRRGKVGSYVDEMPPDVLQAFMCDAEPMLVRQGYLR